MPRSVHTRLEALERSVVSRMPRQRSEGMLVVAGMLHRIKEARTSGFKGEELEAVCSELQRFLKDRKNGALVADSKETRAAALRVSDRFVLFDEAFEDWKAGGVGC